MITEKPLRYNACGTAAVVHVIRQTENEVYDERGTHCMTDDEQ